MSAIVALALKDLRLLLRDRAGFFFAFVFPLLYAAFFGAIFSGVGGDSQAKLQIAVVDLDDTPESRAFIDDLTQTPDLDVMVASASDAEQMVRRGKRLAAITLPQGFGASSDGMFWGEPPEVGVQIDPSRQAESAMLEGILYRCAFQRLQDMFESVDAMSARIDDWSDRVRGSDEMDPQSRAALSLFFPALKTFVRAMPQDSEESADGGDSGNAETSAGAGWQPLVMTIEPVVRQTGPAISSYAWTFPQGIIWGVMGCAAGFGISLVVERTGGTLVRLRMSPIARWQILAGKALACFVTTVAMMTVLLLIAAAVFNVHPQSVWLLAVAVACVAFAFVGIMMLLSVLGKTEQSAGGIGWAVLLVMAMIGGGMVPRIFMPGWMQMLSQISPVKWGIHAMEGAIWRGFSPAEMAVPCAVLLGVGLVCFGLGVRAFRWTT